MAPPLRDDRHPAGKPLIIFVIATTARQMSTNACSITTLECSELPIQSLCASVCVLSADGGERERKIKNLQTLRSTQASILYLSMLRRTRHVKKMLISSIHTYLSSYAMLIHSFASGKRFLVKNPAQTARGARRLRKSNLHTKSAAFERVRQAGRQAHKKRQLLCMHIDMLQYSFTISRNYSHCKRAREGIVVLHVVQPLDSFTSTTAS
jgi:hypothetical protein